MTARFHDPALPIDTIETQINQFCDRIIMCVNARRITLLATDQETTNAKIERLRRRVEGRQLLEATKGEIERFMKENILQETQQLILREVERKLGEVPAVARYEAMRPILAVGKRGKAPGELWYPHAQVIDRNTNHIYVTEGNMFFPRISYS